MTKSWSMPFILLLIAALGGPVLQGVDRQQVPEFQDEREPRLPDGKSLTLEILKKDVEKSSEDMAKVLALATELQEEIERNQFHTVDLGSVRKAEQIIKLVKRVKSRLSRSRMR